MRLSQIRKFNVKPKFAHHYIEQKAVRKVSEIFAQLGEQAFRDMEYECAKELSKSGGTVIATGGGALTFERNHNIIYC